MPVSDGKALAWVPQQVMPIVETPFDRIALDIVGPLAKCSLGYKYILVIINYATRYSEAVPLRTTTATKIAEELLKWVSGMSVPRKIIIDQGTNFMSAVMKAMCLILGIKHIHPSITPRQVAL